MAVPTRPGISIYSPTSPVVCQAHSVNCTIFSDYSIWCDTHAAYITPEQTTNFIPATGE